MSLATPDPVQSSARKGRGARRAERSGTGGGLGPNAWLKVPYIERGVPSYDIASEEQLDRVMHAAERILAEIGIEFREDPETVERFRRVGGKVTQLTPESWNIKFEPGIIVDLCKTAPERFTQYARNPANTVEIGGKATVFAPSYGSPFVMDLDKGRRYGTIEDFQNFIKLAQSSPWLHHSGGTICEPTDVPVNKRHLDMVYSHMRYSDRPFLGSITHQDRVTDTLDMCRILFGADYLETHCVVMGNFNSTSPLVWDGVTTKGITRYAEANQGSILLPFLLGGAVAPLTMAGQVAQCVAESLVGVALTQIVRPGAPALLAGFLSSMSLRTGSPTFGTPEPALGSLVMGQISRRLKLPLRCAGNFSTSKMPDAQAMTQSMMSVMSAVQGGANYILHCAGFLDGLLSMSYEKFVLDTDLCGQLHSYLRGLDFSDDALAVDALAEGGPGVHLFSTQHVLKYYEKAYYDSEMDDNDTHETWFENGSVDSAARANKRWKDILNRYEAPHLDEGIDEALREFIAKKKASMPDTWY
jgi:trimethylamine--corrinoid protein Co-methyltransferase